MLEQRFSQLLLLTIAVLVFCLGRAAFGSYTAMVPRLRILNALGVISSFRSFFLRDSSLAIVRRTVLAGAVVSVITTRVAQLYGIAVMLIVADGPLAHSGPAGADALVRNHVSN